MSRNPEDTAQTTADFQNWHAEVNSRLVSIYCITIVDAGLDEQYLVEHWVSGEAPFEFVEWFGRKYDLTAYRGQPDLSWR
jgi:hypothetical protein